VGCFTNGLATTIVWCMTEAASSRPAHPIWALVLGFVGIAAHLVVGYFYLAAGLVVPLYGIIIFWVLWAALLGLAIWWLRRHPVWILAIPIVAAGILFGGIALGEAVLGWSA
jgi:hypothetical protein